MIQGLSSNQTAALNAARDVIDAAMIQGMSSNQTAALQDARGVMDAAMIQGLSSDQKAALKAGRDVIDAFQGYSTPAAEPTPAEEPTATEPTAATPTPEPSNLSNVSNVGSVTGGQTSAPTPAPPATPESGSLSFDVKITASADAATLAADAAFVGLIADAGAKILLGSSADRSNATVDVTLGDADVARRLSIDTLGSGTTSYAIAVSYSATLNAAQMQKLNTTRAADASSATSMFNSAMIGSTYSVTPNETSFTAALESVASQFDTFVSDSALQPTPIFTTAPESEDLNGTDWPEDSSARSCATLATLAFITAASAAFA